MTSFDLGNLFPTSSFNQHYGNYEKNNGRLFFKPYRIKYLILKNLSFLFQHFDLIVTGKNYQMTELNYRSDSAQYTYQVVKKIRQ